MCVELLRNAGVGWGGGGGGGGPCLEIRNLLLSMIVINNSNPIFAILYIYTETAMQNIAMQFRV